MLAQLAESSHTANVRTCSFHCQERIYYEKCFSWKTKLA